jgi:hypothetical protein
MNSKNFNQQSEKKFKGGQKMVGVKPLNFNIKQLLVTKNSRLDLFMSKNRIYLILFKPVGTKVTDNGKEVPLFRSFKDNKLIEDRSAVKLSEYELGTIVTMFDKFYEFNFNPEKLYKLASSRFSNLISKQISYFEETPTLTVRFYRPEKKFNIKFSPKAVKITLEENGKEYSISIPNEYLKFVLKALEFGINEYFKNYRFEKIEDTPISSEEKDSSTELSTDNGANKKVVKHIEHSNQENNEILDTPIDEEDDFEF